MLWCWESGVSDVMFWCKDEWCDWCDTVVLGEWCDSVMLGKWCGQYDTVVLGEWCDVVLVSDGMFWCKDKWCDWCDTVVLGELCEWGDALVLGWVVWFMWHCGAGWVMWCCDVGWVVNGMLQCWASDVSSVILWWWVNDVMWCLVSGMNVVTLWCWVSDMMVWCWMSRFPYFKGRWYLHVRGFNNPRRMTWTIWPLKMKVIQSFNQEPLTQQYNVTSEKNGIFHA